MKLSELAVGMRIELRHPYRDVWEPEPLTICAIRPMAPGEPWSGNVCLSTKREDGTIRAVYCWYEHVRPAEGT